MTDLPPPGWYHAEGDPPNTQRYWDGTAWQGEPQPAAGGAGQAQPTEPSGTGTPPDTGTPYDTGAPSGPGTPYDPTTPSDPNQVSPTQPFGSPDPYGSGPQPAGPGQPMGASPAYGQTAMESSQATTALICSIVGIFCCGIVLCPLGWYLGQQELTAIDAGRRDPGNRGTANAAKIIGIIGTIIYVIIVIFYALAAATG